MPVSETARRTACLALLAAWATGGLQTARAEEAETCYKDRFGRIVKRQLPGSVEVPCPAAAPGAAPGPESPPASPGTPSGPNLRERAAPATQSPVPRPGITDYVDAVPVPDRWRIVDGLGYAQNLYDPYNRNVLKADKPIVGDWFFNLGLFSDSSYQWRNVASPVGVASIARAGELDVFGSGRQTAFSQTVGAEFTFFEGDTVFKPPDWQFRFSPVFNFNRTDVSELGQINVNPDAGETRSDNFVGIQAAFVEKHLRNVSERYDFDSVRVGIQPFSTDFRGFLFQDNQLGARLFGTRDDNRYQYNLAVFRRIEKDTNSGLNDLGQPLRNDYVVVANLYRRTSRSRASPRRPQRSTTATARPGRCITTSNGFPVRPAPHRCRNRPRLRRGLSRLQRRRTFGDINLTASFGYGGRPRTHGNLRPRTGGYLRYFFGALELSCDFDWIRTRLSLLYAAVTVIPTIDHERVRRDPGEPPICRRRHELLDRQAVPLVGGGRGVTLSGPNGVLNDLRSSKDEGQSNFDNPGTILVGIGADFDVLPELGSHQA